MADFDSFDDLTSDDPRDGALEVTLPSAGLTLPWRFDFLAGERLRDRHDTSLSDVLDLVEDLLGGVDEDVLQEHGIESADEYASLPDEEKAEVAEAMDDDAGLDVTMEVAGRLLHAGFVRFEPDLTLEDVLGALQMEDLTSLPIAEMAGRVTPSADEDAPDVGEDGNKGK